MLFTMVDLISILSCIRARKIVLLPMTPTEIVQFESEKKIMLNKRVFSILKISNLLS
jgi:hypothetical protein